MTQHIWEYPCTFTLESAHGIHGLQLAYRTYGQRSAHEDNIVWVFHALTANDDPYEWWPGLFGPEDVFNEKDYFIICVNVIGSPYGSTAPKDTSFPYFTVRDVVQAQLLLADALNIQRIHVLIGGSFGGSQAMEFAYAFEGQIDRMVLVACAAQESAWGKAIHHAQRLALQADATFGQPGGGQKGLKAARGIGMLVYRTSEAFNQTQTDDDERMIDFKAASYIDYQGDKLVRRFTALSYYYLHRCLDTHHMGRGRGGVERALAQIDIPTLVIAIDTDRLLPPDMQRALASHLPHAIFHEIKSEFGHDGFLIETAQLTAIIEPFIQV